MPNLFFPPRSYLGSTQLVGADIDAETIIGKAGAILEAFAPLASRGCAVPALHVAGVTDLTHPAFQPQSVECVVTDPPYNLKAKVSAGEEVGLSDSQAAAAAVASLWRLAEHVLVRRGRLVYFHPFWHPDRTSRLSRDRSSRRDEDGVTFEAALQAQGLVRTPPGLKLMSAMRQRFTATFSRFLVVMEVVDQG
jgi:tRNA G10  N-methylase Trm11